MKTTLVSSMLLASVATAAWAATCFPIINTNVTVDGIVVGADLGPGGGQPPPTCGQPTADIGWAGVLGQDIPLVVGTGHATPTLFLAAHKGGGASMDKIYIGVHVENAADFTTSDQLTIYFQANGAGGDWNQTTDFALQLGVGPSPPPNKNDGCADPGGAVVLYKRDAGNTTWVSQGTAPLAMISRKTSFDFETAHDAEQNLWELEIGIDVSSLNIVQGGQIGIGAKLYTFDTAVMAYTAYHYPPGLALDESGQDFNPNLGNVTPAKLQKLTVGDCTFDVIISSIQGADDQGNPGQFSVLDPNNPNDFDQTTGAAKRQNQFTAKVKFVDPSDNSKVHPVAIANSGHVAFGLKPWNGGFTDNISMANISQSFNQTGPMEVPLSIKWPTNKSQWRTTLNTANHACFIVDLSGFTVDLPNGNEMQQNLAFVSASTIKTSFLIEAPREIVGPLREQMDQDGTIEYVLRAHWDNLPDKFLSGSKPFKFKITNAAALGLKDIGNGYHLMRLKLGEQKRVELEITGGVMPNPTQQFKLSAKAGGQLLQPAGGDPPLEIPAKAGQTVSILARGLINEGRHSTNANGFQDREQVRQQFLLHRGLYRPEDYIGAVIASCDKFQTGFVVGMDSTFIVPEGCNGLMLAINDVAGRYDDNKGEFDVFVTVGDPIRLPTRLAARGSVANPKLGVPAQMQPGSNLPQFVIDVAQRFKLPKDHRLVPAGYVAYAIFDSHPDQ